MLITRKSLTSGKTHTREVPCTQEQLDAYARGALLQNAFPNLSKEDREFIKTGITPEEWAAIFPPDGDDQ